MGLDVVYGFIFFIKLARATAGHTHETIVSLAFTLRVVGKILFWANRFGAARQFFV